MTTMIGWREWVSLPELGINQIKAKIDTGARTSTLHAFQVEVFREHGGLKIRFAVHPKQYRDTPVVHCIADILEQRWVSDSGGHREHRYVINTSIVVGAHQSSIDLTLTNRDDMRFRMLLGRTALHDHFCVDPSSSFLLGKRKRKQNVCD